jgi:SAM-dependent methyltransferase
MTADARTWTPGELEYLGECPACADPRRRPLYEGMADRLFGVPGLWSSWRCSGCEAAYLDPRPRPDAIARAYPGSYYTHEDGPPPGGVAATRLVTRWLAAGAGLLPLIPRSTRNDASLEAAAAAADPGGEGAPAPRLLDVGCGGGALMARMRSRGWEVEGIDIDQAALEVARAAGLPVRSATVAELVAEDPLPRFDVIALDHVLEHLHDPVASLRDVRHLLRPGGVLWLATPNLAGLGHRTFGRSWMHLDPPRHLVLFSPGALASALAAAGFAPPVTQPAARSANWVFASSAAIERSADALNTPGPLSLRLKALVADLAARRRPELAEELVVAVRAKPSESVSGSA